MIAFKVVYYSGLVREFVCHDETTVEAVREHIAREGKPRSLSFQTNDPNEEQILSARESNRLIT